MRTQSITNYIIKFKQSADKKESLQYLVYLREIDYEGLSVGDYNVLLQDIQLRIVKENKKDIPDERLIHKLLLAKRKIYAHKSIMCPPCDVDRPKSEKTIFDFKRCDL
jgi:hypothetical protein